MAIYTYVCLVGICAFYLYNRSETFKGGSSNLKIALSVFSSIGFISFFIMIITSFFYFTWWTPFVLLIIASVLSSIVNSLFSLINSLVTDIAAITGIILFNSLVWTSLI